MTLNHTMRTSESGGTLIIIGLLTRLAAVPLVIIMIVALISTKLPILFSHDVGMFHHPADMKRLGFWSVRHESRADLTMLLACIYLAIVGAGKWSLDDRLAP
jgi:putative oxidoreductase